MKQIMLIAIKEFRSKLLSPIGFMSISALMVLSGFFFFSLVQQCNSLLQEAPKFPGSGVSAQKVIAIPMMKSIEIITLIALPALISGAIATERTKGTLELLFSYPISSLEIILGKFLGSYLVAIVLLLAMFLFPLSLTFVSNVPFLPLLSGLLGQALFTAAIVAISICCSSIFKDVVTAGITSTIACLLLFLIDAPAESFRSSIRTLLDYLSLANHTDLFSYGVITSSDTVYFLTLTATLLYFSVRKIEKLREGR